MSFFWGTQAIASGTQTTININAGEGTSCLLIGNESGLTVKVTLDGTGSSKSLYPGWVDVFDIPSRGWNGNLLIAPSTMLSNSSSWPSSYLQIDVFGLGERPTGTYPVSLPRLNNIGNAVNTVGGGSTFVQNDANVAGTSIIEATVSGDGSSAVSLTNDAVFILGDTAHKGSLTAAGAVTLNGAGTGLSVANNATVSGTSTLTGDVAAGGNVSLTTNNKFIKGKDQAGTTYNIAGYDGTTAKQLDLSDSTSGILANIQSNTKVNGTFEATGATTLDSTLAVTGGSTLTGAVTATNNSNNIQATTLQAGANVPGGRIGRAADGDILDGNASTDTYLKASTIVHMQVPAGTDAATFTTNGMEVAANKQIKWLAGTTSRLNVVSATVNSNTTVAHGLGTTPFSAFLSLNIAQPGSATLGVGSIGATNVSCTQGSGSGQTCYLQTNKG